MKKYLPFFIALLFSQSTFACLNGERTTLKNGMPLYVHSTSTIPEGNHLFYDTEDNFASLLHELDSLYDATKDLDYLSDKGLVLILSGQYGTAIDVYLEIEKQAPNRYSTASNIGTAYELIGENEKALQWIKRSLEIDPASHDNSEWIHVTILEAKINGESYRTTQHLLKTDFGRGKIPESKLNREELLGLRDALLYQLNERMTFIKPKDKIVAQLLFDLSNVTFLLGDFLVATKDYELAIDYGFDEAFANIRHSQSIHRVLKSREPAFDLRSVIGFSFLGISGLLLVFYIKRRKTKSLHAGG